MGINAKHKDGFEDINQVQHKIWRSIGSIRFYINGFLVAFMDWGIVPKLMHMPLNYRPYLPPPSLGHGHGLGRPLLLYLHSRYLYLGRLWESSDASNLQSLL